MSKQSKRFGFALPCATVVVDVAIIVFIKVFFLLWTLSFVRITSIRSKCGITNIIEVDAMPFLSGTSVVSLIIRWQLLSVRFQCDMTKINVVFVYNSCVLRLLMKPVMLPTCVHLEFMAFPSRSTVPFMYPGILFLIAVDYDNGRELCSVAAVKDFPTGSNVLFDQRVPTDAVAY
ncbi:hypothetical protein T09_3381 [Trichinella sp. T9]|nr:hypothetical protein T09_3381 [Trichinella sp. T9]